MSYFASEKGYSLVELVLVIIIIGILASVAVSSLRNSHDVSRTEDTRTELDRLAWAIAGNPALVSGGSRTDFGYIGDVGALPPNLSALASNPGGYSTWRGPYIGDRFNDGTASTEYLRDAWGGSYSYSSGITITSAGSGSTMTRRIAASVDDILYNRLSVVITDINYTPPGTAHQDSIQLRLTYPDGSGGTAAVCRTPGADGLAVFDSLPIGIHDLQLVHIPAGDTLLRSVAINPGDNSYIEWRLHDDVW